MERKYLPIETDFGKRNESATEQTEGAPLIEDDSLEQDDQALSDTLAVQQPTEVEQQEDEKEENPDDQTVTVQTDETPIEEKEDKKTKDKVKTEEDEKKKSDKKSETDAIDLAEYEEMYEMLDDGEDGYATDEMNKSTDKTNIVAKKQVADNDKKNAKSTTSTSTTTKDSDETADSLRKFLAKKINFTDDKSIVEEIRPLLKDTKTREKTVKHVTDQLKTIHNPKRSVDTIKDSATGKFGDMKTSAKTAATLNKIGREIWLSGESDNPTSLAEAKPFFETSGVAMLTALKNCPQGSPESGYDLKTYIDERVNILFIGHRKVGADNLVREKITDELKRLREEEKNMTATYTGSTIESLDQLEALG